MIFNHYQIKTLYNKVFSVQISEFHSCFRAYTESIQSLIMQIRSLSMILLNTEDGHFTLKGRPKVHALWRGSLVDITRVYGTLPYQKHNTKIHKQNN